MYRLIWVSSLVAIIASILVGLVLLPAFPAHIPSHWNSAGVVDGWQSPIMYVWMVPILTLVVLGVLGGISLHQTNMHVRPYVAMSAGLITAFMLGMHALIGYYTLVERELSIAIFLRLIASLFFGLAIVIRNVPPNHVVGFRLPWTLNHPEVWRRTHQLGFWWMCIGSMTAWLMTFLPLREDTLFGLGMAVLILSTLIPSVYSLRYLNRGLH